MTLSRLVPAPAAPMHVARELVKDLYTESVGLLRDHRGDFYRYDGKWAWIRSREDVVVAGPMESTPAVMVGLDIGQPDSRISHARTS